jgi:hypothetical protein
VGVEVEHRPHLARQAGEHPRVLDLEAGRPAERVVERARPAGQVGPAGGVLGVAAKARAEVGGQRLDPLLRRLEGDCQGLPCDVVGRAAEPARDDQMVDARRLATDEVDDVLGLVRRR